DIDFDVIDVLAAIDGHKCSFATNRTKAQLFGLDFIPPSPQDPTQVPDEQLCEEMYTDFEQAADRANKALRDAQTLLAQYYAGIASGHPLGNICLTVAPNDKLPVGFPGSADCAH